MLVPYCGRVSWFGYRTAPSPLYSFLFLCFCGIDEKGIQDFLTDLHIKQDYGDLDVCHSDLLATLLFVQFQLQFLMQLFKARWEVSNPKWLTNMRNTQNVPTILKAVPWPSKQASTFTILNFKVIITLNQLLRGNAILFPSFVNILNQFVVSSTLMLVMILWLLNI